MGSGWDLRGLRYFEFRVDTSPWNTNTTPIEFSIQLVKPDNTRSSSLVSSTYVTLSPLPGSKGSGDGNGITMHPTLKTVRIPMTAFTNINLGAVRGVRFVFNRSTKGSIYIGAIRASAL